MAVFTTVVLFGTPICLLITVWFAPRLSDQQMSWSKWIDIIKLTSTSVVTKYQSQLSSRLNASSLDREDEHWQYLHDTMKMASHVSYGFVKRSAYKHWVSAGFIKFLKIRRSTPMTREFENKRRFLSRKIVKRLREDLETWWSERNKKLKAAAASGNCQTLCQLIRATGSKKCGVSETICKADGTPITNV